MHQLRLIAFLAYDGRDPEMLMQSDKLLSGMKHYETPTPIVSQQIRIKKTDELRQMVKAARGFIG
jgi:hypothetical protein